MNVRLARRLALAFFLGYTVFLTYPGVLPFNRIRPLVLGLPFSLFWGALWVSAAIAVLALLDRAERSARASDADDIATDGVRAEIGPEA